MSLKTHCIFEEPYLIEFSELNAHLWIFVISIAETSKNEVFSYKKQCHREMFMRNIRQFHSCVNKFQLGFVSHPVK